MTEKKPAAGPKATGRFRSSTGQRPSASTERIPITAADQARAMALGESGMLKSIGEAASAAARSPLLEMAASVRESAEKLRMNIDRAETPPFTSRMDKQLADLARVSLGPSAETLAAHAVRDEVSRLAEITAAMGDQVAAIVELGAELRTAMLDSAAASRRAADVQIWLNRILVALTVVLTGLTIVLALRAA